MMTRSTALSTLLALTLLGGCGSDTPPAEAGTTATAMQDTIEQAGQDATASGAAPSADAPLQPNQTVQGTIEADVGKGSQRFRSLSTKLADDLDKQVAEKMQGNAKVDAAIADANKKLERLGAGVTVSADDMKDVIGGMAGKTLHDSHVMHVGIVKRQTVNLQGRASDGSQVQLSLNFDEQSLAFQDASFSYQPDPKAVMDRFSTSDDNPPEVTIERFEKNADGSFVLSGSFKARDVPAGITARKLAGQTLASASGSFSFASLPAKEMPKFGG